MDHNYWLKKWEAADTRFHKNEVNPNLLKFQNHIPPGTVFVPMCGKSLDMDWLEKQGHKVIGVELSPVACRDFFEENKRPYEVSKNGEFTIFSGSNITLWCGDFFSLQRDALHDVTSVFDRAALVALPPESRVIYGQYLLDLLKERADIRILLVTIEYPQNLVEGPPYSVTEKEVQKLFSDAFKVQLLERHEDLDLKNNHPKFKGITELFECMYVLGKTPS